MRRKSAPTGIAKVIKVAGSAAEVARRLSARGRTCSRQNVEYWVRSGYVTPKWAPAVNAEFGVSLHELNPDVYPASIPAHTVSAQLGAHA